MVWNILYIISLECRFIEIRRHVIESGLEDIDDLVDDIDFSGSIQKINKYTFKNT